MDVLSKIMPAPFMLSDGSREFMFLVFFITMATNVDILDIDNSLNKWT